jgi:hypothetical protein
VGYSGPRFSTGGPAPFVANPFDTAALVVDDVIQNIVKEQLDKIKEDILGTGTVDSVAKLNEALTNLANYDITIPDDVHALAPEFDATVQLNMDVSDIDTSTFGEISSYNVGAPPSADDLPSIDAVTIPDFDPSITGLYIPPTPNPKEFTDPGDAPDSPGFSYPDAPTVTLPDKPALIPIDIPGAPTVELPTLDLADFPIPPSLNIDTLINWTEPTYSPEIWTDAKTQLQTFLAGGTGIRPDVEEAIVNRGRDREDRIVRQQVQQALEEWAGRGYTLPPGLLAKDIKNVREEGVLKKLGLQRDVVIKSMEEELTNLRFAVQQGIVAEDLFVRIHLAAADRLFQVQRLNIEFQIQLHSLAIQLYQAKLTENSIRAQVYEVQVRAALAEIDVYRALIEAEQAKTEVNNSLIRAYTAEIQAREALVNIYTAQVEAVAIQARVFATEVGAYGEEVQAYATRVNADKTRFDAYESQIRGELGKASIVESEARAYQAEISGIEVGVRAQTAVLEGEVSKYATEIEGFNAEVRAVVARNQSELSQIRANVEGHQANISRFVAAANVEEAATRLDMTAWETENSLATEAYRAEIQRLNVIMEKAIKEADLMLEAVRASAELTSTITAGALAAMHVGATASGGGSINSSGSDALSYGVSESYGKDCGTSQLTTINYESDVLPGFVCGFDPTDES